MADRKIAEENAGDFHFELLKRGDGRYACMRSDVSAPAHLEEVTELKDIPPKVLSIFNKLM